MNILCATDLLPKSDAALERAGFLADTLRARLAVVHAVPPTAPDGNTLESRMRAASSQLSSRTSKSSWRWASTPEVVVQFGHPASVVKGNAQRRDVDLLLLGAHRGSAFADAVSGTIADKIIGAAMCPLLIARQPVHGAYGSVLIALDGSPATAAVVRIVESLGLVPARSATVIHAHKPPYAGMISTVGVGAEAAAAYVETSCELAASNVRKLLGANSHNAQYYQIMVVERRPASAILDAVERFKPDLLVMGTRGHGRFRRALLGSIASDVLRTLLCDVLLVPERALVMQPGRRCPVQEDRQSA